MRTALLLALGGIALLPVSAGAAAPMQAVIVHLAPPAVPGSLPAHQVAGRLERDGRAAEAPLLAELAQLREGGHVRHVRSLWITNAVALSADATALAALRARADLRSIEADAQLPIRLADAVTGEPGIAATAAPELWSHGIDGTGVTVATLDTGVDLSHAQLAGRYRGGSDSWFDPYGEHAQPMDLHGHGTQVMGVMVAGNGIGMAPGAHFIAARVFNDAGASTDSAVHLAFQWLLDPDGNPATDDAPDVVNASWGAQLAACDTEFEPDLQALRAAHILPVFAAGNDGPGAATDTSPGNLPEAFAVGAAAGPATIAAFSSTGPSRCGGAQFPSLVAPGTGIRSTDRFGFDATGLAGTSFAAPHVAGALALLLQIDPQLTASEQAALLTQSARDLGTPGPDSTFGAGALDIAGAARLLSPTLDIIPPVLSAAGVAAGQLHLHADDASSTIAGGELWIGQDPGPGAGQPMAPADGAFGSASEDLVGPVAELAPGDHTVGFRARDAAGNWSAAGEIVFTIPALAALPSSSTAPLAPASTLAQPFVPTPLELAVTDGFEAGLGSWRRTGAVRALRAAAISGRRGMRIQTKAGARSFAQRPLARPAARLELSFTVRAGAISSPGWSSLASIDGADGSHLAGLELLTTGRRAVRVRLAVTAASGAISHSRPVIISRGPTRMSLALDAAHALLTLDGRERATAPRSAGPPTAAAVDFGARSKASSQASGYLDIDDVAVLSAPD